MNTLYINSLGLQFTHTVAIYTILPNKLIGWNKPRFLCNIFFKRNFSELFTYNLLDKDKLERS